MSQNIAASRERERERINKKTKLEFIKNDITNLAQLKRDSESNISTIVKYFALSLGAFFAFIVFFTSKNSDLDKQIFSIIGICFLIFAIAITYYTSYTLSKNLKRRILYRREIIALRAIANKLMNYIYKNNTVCTLKHNNYKFTKFDNLPTIAMIMGTAAPSMLYIFLTGTNTIPSDYIWFIIFISIIVICGIFSNLFTHHKNEMLLAKHTTSTKTEDKIKEQIRNIYISRRKNQNTSKIIKFALLLTTSLFIFSILFKLICHNINFMYIQSAITFLVVVILFDHTRYKNHKKPFLYFIWNNIEKLIKDKQKKVKNNEYFI